MFFSLERDQTLGDESDPFFLFSGGNMMSRPTWTEYFISIVDATALRASCNRGKSGAIIVSADNRILSGGYVGNASGAKHCDDIGHTFRYIIEQDEHRKEILHEGFHCISTVHAEANAICNSAKKGISIDNSIMFCTMVPCFVCAKLIIQSGIKRVVAKYDYHHSEQTKKIFEELRIELVILNDEECYDSNEV